MNTFTLIVVDFLLGATGLYASCSIELSPPSVVVRYGASVSVNCSTPEVVELLGWEAANGGDGMKENVSHVTWSVESLTQWDARPQCVVNDDRLNPTQCSHILPVVLYTIPDRIAINSTAGTSGIMIEGKEYELSCDIEEVAPVKNLLVRWFLGHKNETQTFNDSGKDVDNISSKISFEPRRDDDGIRIRCEAQLELGPDGPLNPVISQEYQISVHFGPEIHCLEIKIKEGTTLEGQCDVSGNPVPTITWLKDGLPIDLQMPLQRNNAGLYTITAEGQNVTQKKISVSVFYEPELDCPDNYTVAEYETIHLPCNVSDDPSLNVTWYYFREGEPVDIQEKVTRSNSGQYTVIASTDFFNVSRSVDIIVLYPPSQINELEDLEVELGSSEALKCTSKGNPRPTYFWTHFGATNVYVINNDGVSLLHIQNATGDNTGSYKCHAWNNQGGVSKEVNVTVKGAKPECPITITPERLVVQYAEKGAATCTSTSTSIPKQLYWELPQHIINSSQWSSDSHTVWDPRPICKVMFEGGRMCQKPFDFTLYRTPNTPFISIVNHTGPLLEGSMYLFQCDISNVAPIRNLKVRWYKGKETIGTVDTYNDTTKTPVNTSSSIIVTMDKTVHGAEFRCEAQLDLGPEGSFPRPTVISHPLNVTVHYKPVINATKLPKTIPVFRGYSEELVCEAEGHPLPTIQWKYNPDSHVRESGGNLTIFEAGLYTCFATNDVANSSFEVKAVFKEDYLPLIAGFVAVTVVIISVIFVFIYSIYYKNTKMRRYNVKNPKLSTQNGNVAHNGWDVQLPMTKLS